MIIARRHLLLLPHSLSHRACTWTTKGERLAVDDNEDHRHHRLQIQCPSLHPYLRRAHTRATRSAAKGRLIKTMRARMAVTCVRVQRMDHLPLHSKRPTRQAIVHRGRTVSVSRTRMTQPPHHRRLLRQVQRYEVPPTPFISIASECHTAKWLLFFCHDA